MQFDMGRAFSDALAAFTSRFGRLFGTYLIFLVLLLVVGGGFVMALMPDLGSLVGPDGSPASGMIGTIILLYIVIYAIQFAQQVALTRLGSTRLDAQMGEAIGFGFRSIPTMFGIAILMLIAMIVVMVVLSLLFALVGVAAGSAGAMGIGSVIMMLVMLVCFLLVGAKLSMVLPVVAIDAVRNPITALTRAWQLSNGNTWRLVLLFFLVVVAMGGLFAVLFMATIGIPGPDSVPSPGGVIGFGIGALIFGLTVGLYFYTLLAAIHEQLSGPDASGIADTFA